MDENKIYEKVIENLLSEFSGAASIGGYALPLGAANDDPVDFNKKIKYKPSNATDKIHRSKKQKTKNKSVQYYLNKKNK